MHPTLRRPCSAPGARAPDGQPRQPSRDEPRGAVSPVGCRDERGSGTAHARRRHRRRHSRRVHRAEPSARRIRGHPDRPSGSRRRHLLRQRGHDLTGHRRADDVSRHRPAGTGHAARSARTPADPVAPSAEADALPVARPRGQSQVPDRVDVGGHGRPRPGSGRSVLAAREDGRRRGHDPAHRTHQPVRERRGVPRKPLEARARAASGTPLRSAGRRRAAPARAEPRPDLPARGVLPGHRAVREQLPIRPGAGRRAAAPRRAQPARRGAGLRPGRERQRRRGGDRRRTGALRRGGGGGRGVVQAPRPPARRESAARDRARLPPHDRRSRRHAAHTLRLQSARLLLHAPRTRPAHSRHRRAGRSRSGSGLASGRRADDPRQTPAARRAGPGDHPLDGVTAPGCRTPCR